MSKDPKLGIKRLTFYPTKSWIDDVINEDKFLKVLTFSGETMKKKIVSHAEMIAEISSYLLHDYTAISNNTLPQYTRYLNVTNCTHTKYH